MKIHSHGRSCADCKQVLKGVYVARVKVKVLSM